MRPGIRSRCERFLQISDLRVKTGRETQRVGMRAPVSRTAPRPSSPLTAREVSPSSQQKRPALPLCTTAAARSNTLSCSRLSLASVVARTMVPWSLDTAHDKEERPDSDEFLAGFGHLGCLRAKTTFQPEVLSRRTFFRKGKTTQFRKAHDDASGR